MNRLALPLLSLSLFFLSGCNSERIYPQKDPEGAAVSHTGYEEIPQRVFPNDATISLYEERKANHIRSLSSKGELYTVLPKGNSSEFRFEKNPVSKTLERQLSDGYILSYLYYDDGVVKYNGIADKGRFSRDITDETLFFTHSTGKSITSYIVGHAICEGYINSVDEIIDWPMMSKTLYQGQPLIDLLNMRAGDKHTVDERNSSYIMGSNVHHRHMGLDTIAALLDGTEKRGRSLFYNNFLSDVIANYVAFKAGDSYDELMRKVFQDKVKVENPVSYGMHRKTFTDGDITEYFGTPQTLASYSFYMTRFDFLRVAKAMMEDYQNETCVGKYLKEIQNRSEPWYRDRIRAKDAFFWLNSYAQNYGGQFYLKFSGMSDRNIFGTEGKNGQDMLIDMDNSRIVVTNSANLAWDVRTYILNVINSGKLPE